MVIRAVFKCLFRRCVHSNEAKSKSVNPATIAIDYSLPPLEAKGRLPAPPPPPPPINRHAGLNSVTLLGVLIISFLVFLGFFFLFGQVTSRGQARSLYIPFPPFKPSDKWLFLKYSPPYFIF